MDPFAIAGTLMTGIGLYSQLKRDHKDATKWEESDLPIDRDYLALAIAKGQIPGTTDDYCYMSERKLPTAELAGSHEVVVSYNSDRQVKHRLVRGQPPSRTVLVRKLAG